MRPWPLKEPLETLFLLSRRPAYNLCSFFYFSPSNVVLPSLSLDILASSFKSFQGLDLWTLNSNNSSDSLVPSVISYRCWPLPALSVILLPLPSAVDNHKSTFCLFKFAYCGLAMSGHLWLASFTHHNVLKVHPCHSMYQYFNSFYWQIIFYSVNRPHFCLSIHHRHLDVATLWWLWTFMYKSSCRRTLSFTYTYMEVYNWM